MTSQNERIEVRRCTSKDAPALARLGAQTFRDTFAADNTTSDMDDYLAHAYRLETVQDELADPDSMQWIVSVEGCDAAFLKLNVGAAQTERVQDRLPQPSLEVQRIYVREEFKRRGLGAMLMRLALDEARGRGAASLWLGVWERNTAALAFYERMGLRRFGEHTFVIGQDRQTDYLMALDLRSASDLPE